MPGAGGTWLRPPPGMTVTYTVERIGPPRPNRSPRVPQGLPAAAPAAASTTAPAGPSAPVPQQRKEARPMGGSPAVQGVENVQYADDSELTVYDVIESDEDMAQQIMAGADHARIVRDRCQDLVSSLESLYFELVDRKVPGALSGWCARLIEKAHIVESKAEGLAAGLPRASEAIAHAGQVAADYDKQPADITADMGHSAPAEAEYHQE